MCHLSLLLTTRGRRRCARAISRRTSERRVRNSLVRSYERAAVSHSYHRDDGHGIAGNVQYSENCCVARRRVLVCHRSLFTPRAQSFARAGKFALIKMLKRSRVRVSSFQRVVQRTIKVWHCSLLLGSSLIWKHLKFAANVDADFKEAIAECQDCTQPLARGKRQKQAPYLMHCRKYYSELDPSRFVLSFNSCRATVQKCLHEEQLVSLDIRWIHVGRNRSFVDHKRTP